MHTIQTSLATPWFRIPINDYGHFYFNLTMAIAYPYSALFPLTERAIVFILRLVSLLGGYATIALVYIFAKRYLGWIAAFFAAIVMGFSPLFVMYSLEIKPETWQIFFIVLSLYWLARAFEASEAIDGPRTSWRLRAHFGFVLGASAAAGAAFGTKYQGIFLIPFLAYGAWKVTLGPRGGQFSAMAERAFVVLGLPLGFGLAMLGLMPHEQILSYLLVPVETWSPSLLLAINIFRVCCLLASPVCLAAAAAYALGLNLGLHRTTVARRAAVIIATGLAFIAAFTVSSPWLMWHLQFLSSIYLRSRLIGEGDHIGFLWLKLLFGYDRPDFAYVAYGTGALSVIGGVLLLMALVRRDFRGARLPFLFVLGFAVIFATVLIESVNSLMGNYALPMVAPLALLAAFGLHEIRDALPRWLSARTALAAATAFTILVIAAQIWQGGAVLLNYPNLFVALSPENRKLGEWFERCVPRNAMILAAPYSYVPPEFRQFAMNEGYAALEKTSPDVVITTVSFLAGLQAEPITGRPNSSVSDAGRFFNILMHSGTWWAGPSFGQFQVHAKKKFALLSACR